MDRHLNKKHSRHKFSHRSFKTNDHFIPRSKKRSLLFLGLYLSIILSTAAVILVTRSRSQKQTSAPSSADDSWKKGLYTNRTLHRDQDPLLHDQTNSKRRKESDEEYTNMSFPERIMLVPKETKVYNTFTGKYWEDFCHEIACYRQRSVKILQDLILLAQLQQEGTRKKQSIVQHATGDVESLSPRVRHLVAAAAYGLDEIWDTFQDVNTRNMVK